MTTTTYRVEGMTCDHCVRAVTEELRGVPGVLDVRVDLASGEAVLTSETPVGREAVEAAVDEAGYALAP